MDSSEEYYPVVVCWSMKRAKDIHRLDASWPIRDLICGLLQGLLHALNPSTISQFQPAGIVGSQESSRKYWTHSPNRRGHYEIPM